jgi:hypothetical protein
MDAGHFGRRDSFSGLGSRGGSQIETQAFGPILKKDSGMASAELL